MHPLSTVVNTQTLAAHIDDPRWVIVDCRFTLTAPAAGETAYAKEHLPGAHYAHLDRDLSQAKTSCTGRHPLPEPESFAATLGRWGIQPGVQVVVYDDSFGAIAARLWWMLRYWVGHDAVALLDGGLQKWKREARPVNGKVVSPHAGAYIFTPHRDGMVSAPDLAKALAHQDVCLIDARPERRFSGEDDPIDPVAGHIPGSLNWPFEENLDIDSTLMSPPDLTDAYRELIGAYRPEQVVHSCGSGVTACLNLLAMEHAGLEGSRLYAGSWSEWITDPARAVETGPRRGPG
jgi:thiosulfate/3-mercaptopyruvate sulfurtransferase